MHVIKLLRPKGGRTCSRALFKCRVISIHFNVLKQGIIDAQFRYSCIYKSHIYEIMESYPLVVINDEQMLCDTQHVEVKL